MSGAISNESASFTVINSTFSRNRAKRNKGGGIQTLGKATISHSTFYANSAQEDGGGGLHNPSANLSLYNSIIANSTGGGDCRANLANNHCQARQGPR